MAGAKTKVPPAVQAEGEAQQNAVVQDDLQQVPDSAIPPDGLPPADVAGDNQEPQEVAPLEGEAEAQVDAVEANAIEVVAKCESFRRAGREFTRTSVTILLEDLTEAEIKLLEEEPLLSVQYTHVAEEG